MRNAHAKLLLGCRWKVFDFEHWKCFLCFHLSRFCLMNDSVGLMATTLYAMWKCVTSGSGNSGSGFVLHYLPFLMQGCANISPFLDKATTAEPCPEAGLIKIQLCTQHNWALPTKSRQIKCKPTTEISKPYLLKLEELFPMPVFFTD